MKTALIVYIQQRKTEKDGNDRIDYPKCRRKKKIYRHNEQILVSEYWDKQECFFGNPPKKDRCPRKYLLFIRLGKQFQEENGKEHKILCRGDGKQRAVLV